MAMSFELYADGGIFVHPDDRDSAGELLDAAMDAADAGELSNDGYLDRLREIVAKYPDFIDGHAHLGFALYNARKPKLALASSLRGLDLGMSVLPKNYDGLIEWGYLENRPFLRAAQGVVLSYLKLNKRPQAIASMEQMLAWNPSDNHGIRYLIGPEYLRAGAIEKAHAIFEANAAHYPPYRYELALLLIREGHLQEAATQLRHGFLANGYIAEMLCGMLDPLPLAIWHGSNLAEIDTAREYVSRCEALWIRTADALPLLRWLHTHPKVLAERVPILASQEALLWEHEYEKRRPLVDAQFAALAKIDDRLSRELIQPRIDRDGRAVMPWHYPATRI